MASKGKSSGGGKHRSAITGRYVISKHGKASPNTTVKESKQDYPAEGKPLTA